VNSTVTSQQPLDFGADKAVKSFVPNRLEFLNMRQKVRVVEFFIPHVIYSNHF